MSIKIRPALSAPTDKVIDSFESFYRVKLPSSFVKFFKKHNGAVCDQLIIPVDNQDRLVERVLCLLDDPKAEPVIGQYDIGVVIAQIEDRLTDDEDLVGTNLIPFASVFGGDFLCLDFRTLPSQPSVVLWDHNESDELEPVTFHVTDTFENFIELL